MADRIEIDDREFRALLRNFRDLHGDKVVNKWVASAYRGPTSTPLKRALRAITPKRTGILAKSINHRVETEFTAEGKSPVLLIGGIKKLGGYVYNFLRGTRERQTRKGRARGSIKDLKLEERSLAIGRNATLARFRDRLYKAMQKDVRRLQAKIRAAR